jgi:predicted RNA-binding Zn-ribbon protein involved in translation (DUF1610 family)
MVVKKQTVGKALNLKAPDMPKPQRLQKLDTPCPKCGQKTIVCCHTEDGATDYYDNFCHVCLNPHCDYAQYKMQYSGLGQESKGDHLCPFCGRDVYSHN